MFLRLFILMFSSINVGEAIAERASTVAEVKMSYCFQKREDFLLSLGGGGFTSTLPTCHAQGWREVSWFSRGCGWGRGCVGTTHTGCRTGTHWPGQTKTATWTHCKAKTHSRHGLCFMLQCVLGLPALVGPFRGEFVAAAAVWGVAKGPIRGGGTRPGPYNTTTGPDDLKGPIRCFVGTTLARKVTAHPFNDLFHHFVLKLWKKREFSDVGRS